MKRSARVTDDEIKLRLLAMIVPKHDAFHASLSPQAWETLCAIAEQYRLGPILHHNAGHVSGTCDIPDIVRQRWHASYRDWALRALSARSTLVRIASMLDCGGIAYAALKGAWLAWHAYPQVALRPMRDLDILVERADILRAYELLLDAGLERTSTDPTLIAYALDHNKHLPGLRDPISGCYVELHCRIAHEGPSAPLDSTRVLASRFFESLNGATIAYLSPTNTLLHLIVHSAYDHRFDNGPQILTDIAILTERPDIDWDWFWDAAKRGDWERGCLLLLRLCHDFYGNPIIRWEQQEKIQIPTEIQNEAAMLMLQDPSKRRDLSVRISLSEPSLDGLWRQISRRLLVPSHVISSFSGMRKSGKCVWIFYPLWLVSKAVRTLVGLFSKQQRREVRRAIAVDHWLADAEEARIL